MNINFAINVLLFFRQWAYSLIYLFVRLSQLFVYLKCLKSVYALRICNRIFSHVSSKTASMEKKSPNVALKSASCFRSFKTRIEHVCNSIFAMKQTSKY